MPDHFLLRWMLFPLSLLFGLAVALKNVMYRVGLLSGVRFDIPVVSVGNLTVGGAGKTPHVEYLVRLLRPYVRTSVMSRGFGRQSSGFRLVHPGDQSTAVGDEPLIFARKYRDVLVSVSESRSLGIPRLLQHHPELQVILLDDAYQHRSVSPHINILLTEYAAPFYKDWLMPTGALREWRGGYHRADIIIVTKCPVDLSDEARVKMLTHIRPGTHQRVFFSAYKYHVPYAMYSPGSRIELSADLSVLLVCGIAKTDYLYQYVQGRSGIVDLMQFEDHHDYNQSDLDLINMRFENLPGEKKIVLTTEKDAVRLERFGTEITAAGLPLFLLPVEVVFLFDEGGAFNAHMHQLLLDFKI